jgi:hypothetical protein
MESIQAEFFYRNPLEDGEEKPAFGLKEEDPNRPKHTAYNKTVKNARGTQHSLAESGFKLINHQSTIQDFYDDQQITSVYYKEMHDVVKEETGADEVIIFSHIARNEEEAALGKRKGAHRLVHNDFTPSFEENHLSFLQESEDKPKRITVYNLWRRFDKDGIDAPFALCDSRSVSEKELIPTDLFDYVKADEGSPGAGVNIEIYQSSFSEGHEWNYYPKMNRDEVVMFKTFDSVENPFLPTLHSAFDDVSSKGMEVTPRESIEVRAICFFNEV